MKKGLFIAIVMCFIFGFGITAVFTCDETGIYGEIEYSIGEYLPGGNGGATQDFSGCYSGNGADSSGSLSADGSVYADDSSETLDDGTLVKSNYTESIFDIGGSVKNTGADINFETEIGSTSEITSGNNSTTASHKGKLTIDYEVDSSNSANFAFSGNANGYTAVWQSEDGSYLGAETSSIFKLDSSESGINPVNTGSVNVHTEAIDGNNYCKASGNAEYVTGANVQGTAYSDSFSHVYSDKHRTYVSTFVSSKTSQTAGGE